MSYVYQKIVRILKKRNKSMGCTVELVHTKSCFTGSSFLFQSLKMSDSSNPDIRRLARILWSRQIRATLTVNSLARCVWIAFYCCFRAHGTDRRVEVSSGGIYPQHISCCQSGTARRSGGASFGKLGWTTERPLLGAHRGYLGCQIRKCTMEARQHRLTKYYGHW